MIAMFTFPAILLLTVRCVWELVFQPEDNYDRSRPVPLPAGLSILSGLVSMLLAAEIVSPAQRTSALLVMAVVQLALVLSVFGKRKWGRGVNFLLRLLLAPGFVLHLLLAWKMRSAMGTEPVLVSGLLVLLPLIAAALLLVELLYNYFLTHHHKIGWPALAETGIAAAAVFLMLHQTTGQL